MRETARFATLPSPDKWISMEEQTHTDFVFNLSYRFY